MPKLIKNGQIVEDNWTVLAKPENPGEVDLTETNLIVPMAVWLAQKEQLSARQDIGIWIDSDEEVEAIAEHIGLLPLIAVNFPSFRDGRGYSTARLLRERYGFQGEIRAIGDVLQDQLFYMSRCGISSFVIRADRSLEKALAGLKVFTERYQAAVDEPQPLFRRRNLPAAKSA